MSKILSCLTLSDAYKSIYSILKISEIEVNNFLCKIDDCADISINDFINTYDIDASKKINIDCILVSHVTTAFDECEYIKNNGLTNTRKVFEYATPLKRFLKENNIEIKTMNNEYGLYYKDKCINTEEENNLFRMKLDHDYQINTIFYSDDAIKYGNVKYCPEILREINKKIPLLIEDLWIKNTKPYVLTLKIKIEQIKSCTFYDRDYEFGTHNFTSDDKNKWLIKKVLEYIYNVKNFNTVSDKYFFLNDNVDIMPECIMDIKEEQR